jgi:hypothetical protein
MPVRLRQTGKNIQNQGRTIFIGLVQKCQISPSIFLRMTSALLFTWSFL